MPRGHRDNHECLVRLCGPVRASDTCGSWLVTDCQTIDHGLSVVSTKEWQDNLARSLASGSTPSSCTPDSKDGHASQRRRLDGYCKVTPADWNSLLTIDNLDGTHQIDLNMYVSYSIYFQMNLREIQRKVWANYH